jgi:uncharacterized membrane protein
MRRTMKTKEEKFKESRKLKESKTFKKTEKLKKHQKYWKRTNQELFRLQGRGNFILVNQ